MPSCSIKFFVGMYSKLSADSFIITILLFLLVILGNKFPVGVSFANFENNDFSFAFIVIITSATA